MFDMIKQIYAPLELLNKQTMKRNMMLLLGILSPLFCIAQKNSYLPFVVEGKVWHYKESNPNVSSEYYSEWQTDYMLKGDTVIGNYSCKKLYVTSDCPFNKRERLYSGALFEKDSLVYHIYPNGTEPYLLYDFTTKEGEDVSIYGTTLTILRRQIIQYNGRMWLVLTWSPKEFEVDKSFLIEGLGCLDNRILDYFNSWNPGAYRCQLLTCEVGGEEVFSSKTFPLVNEPVTFTAGQMATIVLPTEPDVGRGNTTAWRDARTVRLSSSRSCCLARTFLILLCRARTSASTRRSWSWRG